MISKPRVVVVGSSFAGFTAALQLAEELGAASGAPRAEITVISSTDTFTFIPSLIWVPFGLRTREDITFPLEPPLFDAGVTFAHTVATSIDLEERRVLTTRGAFAYDHLLVATGPRLLLDAVPGLRRHAHGICTLDQALETRAAFESLLEIPGPAVVGAMQGASCLSAAYELVLNLALQVRRRGLSGRIPITFVTPEPHLGHLGMGELPALRSWLERAFERLDIHMRTNRGVASFTPASVLLDGGERLTSRFSAFVPAFGGAQVVSDSPGLGNAEGLVEVDDAYRHPRWPNVYAAGVAVAARSPFLTAVPVGVPRTGHMSEAMARVAARNIAASILGQPEVRAPLATLDARAVIDAGDGGAIFGADHALEPLDGAWLVPGPEAHWAKVAFERYFLATRRRGLVV
jgi:sulfide:quinone oxidoreductase